VAAEKGFWLSCTLVLEGRSDSCAFAQNPRFLKFIGAPGVPFCF
jgi:hypothetical protein